MMKKLLLVILSAAVLFGCSQKEEPKEEAQEVNVYTHRHYDSDKELFKKFEEETGIKVNVVNANADELMTRMMNEGADSPADVLITVDAGRLHKAKENELLQPVSSEVLSNNIPANLKDSENYWYGLTKRARVIVVNKAIENDIKNYWDLTNPKWKEKVLIRSSGNIYNQSLLASMIAHYPDSNYAEQWAEGVVKNMARTPAGGDRDQIKAIAGGIGDVAVVNTYYLGKMLKSDDPNEVEAGEMVNIIFPNQDGRGTHINVSGAGVAKNSKNKENAIKFIEFLSSKAAQEVFAEANYEYPVNPEVEASELLKGWGEFKEDDISLTKLGEYNTEAVKIFDRVGWK